MARLAYIFTTFPKLSEQFFMREVLELQAQGVDIDLYSLIDGEAESEAGPVVEMSKREWFRLLPELIYWCFRCPLRSLGLIGKTIFNRYGSWINYGENLLGLAFAFTFARRFKEADYCYAHATWATAPGMAAYAMNTLIKLPYTLEAHAYDVFRDGGDLFLREKLNGASRIRSSTDATTDALKEIAPKVASDILCVRRGLGKIPEYVPPVKPDSSIQILTVGRLIEKKGYDKQLKIYEALKRLGVAFRGTIVGEGELYHRLEELISELGLSAEVQLAGKLGYSEVEDLYQTADLFIFTGIVSTSGDRDGFPNVIGEAMSYSLPVFSTDVSGTTEAIREGETGFLIDDVDDPQAAAEEIASRLKEWTAIPIVTANGHEWICSSFEISTNIRALRAHLWPDFE